MTKIKMLAMVLGIGFCGCGGLDVGAGTEEVGETEEALSGQGKCQVQSASNFVETGWCVKSPGILQGSGQCVAGRAGSGSPTAYYGYTVDSRFCN